MQHESVAPKAALDSTTTTCPFFIVHAPPAARHSVEVSGQVIDWVVSNTLLDTKACCVAYSTHAHMPAP